MLCDLLTDTGVAGAPNSFYRQLSIPYWIECWGVTEPMGSPGFDRAYLNAALRVGTADTNLFGMRLMWNGVTDLSKRLNGLFPGLESDGARFDGAFGSTTYLYLSRDDLVAQAVSRYRAEQGGLWHKNADGSERERVKSEPVLYDAAGIAAYFAEVEADMRCWEDWFSTNGIVPHRLTYERLSENPQSVLTEILAALGLDPALAGAATPRTKKLADAESAEWGAWFKSEMT